MKNLIYIFFPFLLFRRERNCRLFCKKCGQQYDLYELPSLPGQHDRYGYEEMRCINDETCVCHKLVIWV